MKNLQQQQARELFFQTTLTKTDIAEKLGVNRRTIYQWSVEGDWEKLRISARTMPSILAEKCYYLIGHFTDHLLSKESFYQSVTKADVDIIFKLTKTINLLKKGSTVNENMETFTHFLETLQAKDPDLADAVMPHIDSFVTDRSAASVVSSPLDGFTPQGYKSFPEKEIMEKWQDEQDAEALLHEMQQQAATTAQQPITSDETTKAKDSYTYTSVSSPLPAAPNLPTPPPSAPLSRAEKEKNYKSGFWNIQDKARQRKQASKQRKAA